MKDKTIIKFYRGCFSMGIVISVSYNNDRIIFDFGAPFNPKNEILDGTILTRNNNRVKDAILLGKIPPIDGIFAKDMLGDLQVIPYENSNVNSAIFICHLHEDHMSEIDKVATKIPVYIGKEGLDLLHVLEETNEVIHYRDYNYFEYGKTINIGSISVKAFYNNHPCPGTASFLIKTPDQTILYTGDIRFHGQYYKKAWEEIDKISKEKIDLLIIDSTTTSPSEFVYEKKLLEEYKKPSRKFLEGEIKETDMYDNIYNSLKDFDGIGIYNQYPRDVDMLLSMHNLSTKLNRITVFEPLYAYILYKLKGIKCNVFFPDVNKNPAYYDILKDNCNIISIDQIRNKPSKYILQNSYRNILSLIDLDGIKGKYFHLLGTPLVKESKEWNILLNFIEKLNFEFYSYINLYSFSHAYPNHLAEVIKTINAKSVVAVHSKHPENLNPLNSIQVIPEQNVNYLLENGLLSKIENKN